VSGDIVPCHVGKSVQFMTKTNCAARGGREG
jgi:hypothetical protein